MVVGTILNRIMNLLNSLGGGQKRHFSTENSNSTEQSTKWDKLEGKLTSDLVNLESWKEIKEGDFGTIDGLLEGTLSLKDLKSIDLKELEIPFIFDFNRPLFAMRFVKRFYYIHSQEKSEVFSFFCKWWRKTWLYFVGPKGSFEFVFFFDFSKNNRIWKESLPLCDGCLFMV